MTSHQEMTVAETQKKPDIYRNNMSPPTPGGIDWLGGPNASFFNNISFIYQQPVVPEGHYQSKSVFAPTSSQLTQF